MKKVYSHVLVEFDKDDKNLIQKIVDKIALVSEAWFGISRIFIKADFDREDGWIYTDVKNPSMSRTKLLEDLRLTRYRIKAIDELLADLQEKVKNTK